MKVLLAQPPNSSTLNNSPVSFVVNDSFPLPSLQPYEILVEVRACSIEFHPKFIYDLQTLHNLSNNPTTSFDQAKVSPSSLSSSSSLSLSSSSTSSSSSGPGNSFSSDLLNPTQSSTTSTIPGYGISGVVAKLGSGFSGSVGTYSNIAIGDEIAGLIAFDSKFGGFSEYAVVNILSIIKKPSSIPHTALAASLLPGVSAVTSLFYKARITKGESVLILGTACADGAAFATAQLALAWGATVFTAVTSDAEEQYVASLLPSARVIRCNLSTSGSASNFSASSSGSSGSSVSSLISSNISATSFTRNKRPLLSEILKETSGLGVDVIIDFGLVYPNSSKTQQQQQQSQQQPQVQGYTPITSKFDIISCLAVNGRWITSLYNLQLDPPDSALLMKKSATVSFLNEHAWMLSGSQQGKLVHILKEVVDRLEDGKMVPKIGRTLNTLEDLRDFYLSQLSSNNSALTQQQPFFGCAVYEAS